MDGMYRALFEVLKAILQETDNRRLASGILQRTIDFTGAARGFIVVRQDRGFRESYNVHFDQARVSAEKRRFSRSLVREAIRGGDVLCSRDLSADPRFRHAASIEAMKAGSVMAIPLGHGGDVHAVIYLEKQPEAPAFSERDMVFAREICDLAGLSLHLAVERDLLRRLEAEEKTDLFARFDFGNIITRHPKMLALLRDVAQVADSDAPILVRGETGTGKELIAQALYKNSPRRKKPFVTLHCGALPETLLEAELFGHTRGAYTGAVSDRAGRVAQADGGTLFIDEVAEIPLTVQAKLLRFFQTGEFQRLGSDRVDRVNVRIVAATHQNLMDMVGRGRFRQDLYYRINVVELELPPLRERRSDIDLLCAYFLKKYWKRPEGPPSFTPRAQSALRSYDYPGNIRELAHIIERTCLLAREPELDIDHLPREVLSAFAQHDNGEATGSRHFEFPELTNQALKSARKRATKNAANEAERAFLQQLIGACGDRIAEAATAAGMQRTYLYKLLAKHRMR